MTISRRGFLGALLAAGIAPAIVRPASLMKIWVPPEPKIWVPDWSAYDGTGLDAGYLLQRCVREMRRVIVPAGVYFIGTPVELQSNTFIDMSGSRINMPEGSSILKAEGELENITLQNLSCRELTDYYKA